MASSSRSRSSRTSLTSPVYTSRINSATRSDTPVSSVSPSPPLSASTTYGDNEEEGSDSINNEEYDSGSEDQITPDNETKNRPSKARGKSKTRSSGQGKQPAITSRTNKSTAKESLSSKKSRTSRGERSKTPGGVERSQQTLRFAVLYAFPVILTLPLSLLLSLDVSLLTPLYNSLPLTLHNPALYFVFAIPPALVYWHATLDTGPKYAISARVCFLIAALAGDVAAVSGRRIGSQLGSLLGPELGAWTSRFVLGMGAVGGGTVFALLCFDHISPLGLARTPDARLRNLMFILIRSGAYIFHVWFVEMIWQDRAIQWNAEKTMLFVSLLLTALSLFVRPATPSIPFSQRVYSALTAKLPVKSPVRSRIYTLTSYLPRQSFPVLLLLRLPLLILALRQQIFLKPLPPYIAAGGALRVLSTEKSLTGQIVVAENIRGGYRFLRCDHSILGGRWSRHVDDRRGGTKVQMGDSIFATFPLQEIAVLAHRHDVNETAIETLRVTSDLVIESALEDLTGEEKAVPAERALIIGLGVGITADALARRNYAVDIVEIDPAVTKAAFDYFGLNSSAMASTNNMDGAAYVHNLAEQHRSGIANSSKWSYVIQDCFSGGGIPSDLFTIEFWEEIQDITLPDAVVAMNYVGLRNSKTARSVLVTFLSVFSQCRAFGDVLEKDRGPNEVINIVVFCTSTHSPLLTFRKPVAADVIRSPVRSHVYSTFLQNEIQLDSIIHDEDWTDPEFILRRGEGHNLDTWQIETSLAVWRTMQQILTPAMWLAY